MFQDLKALEAETSSDLDLDDTQEYDYDANATVPGLKDRMIP